MTTYNKKKEFCIKVHAIEGKRILAICDKEILGKIFEQGNFVLNVSKNFYYDKFASFEEIKELIKRENIYIINAVGKKIIEKLKSNNFIEKTFEINSIPITYIMLEYNKNPNKNIINPNEIDIE